MSIPVCGSHGAQVSFDSCVYGTHGAQVEAGWVSGTHGAAIGFTEEVHDTHGAMYQMMGGLAASVYLPSFPSSVSPTPNTPGTTNWKAKIDQQVGFRVRLNGDASDDLSGDALTASLEESRNDPGTFTLVLADEPAEVFGGSRLGKYRPNGGSLAPKFFGDNINANYGVRRYLTVEVGGFGDSYTGPFFLPSSYTWSYNNGFPIATVRGYDFSHRLMLSDQSMDDFINMSCHAIIRAILKKFGISSVRLAFQDYHVFQFSPKGGTPLDWIKQLLWVRQAEWYWDAGTFIAKDRGYKGSGGSEWVLEDFIDLDNFEYTVDTQELRNEFVVRRVEKAGSALTDIVECRGGHCLGRREEKLARPANAVVTKILQVVHGKLQEFSWRVGDEPLNSQPTSVYTGATPAEKVQFTYYPTIRQAGFGNAGIQSAGWPPGVEPGYMIQFLGTPNRGEEYEPGFQIRIKDAGSQEKYGVRRDEAPIESQLIPDKEAAETLAFLLMDENIRLTNFAKASGLCHPFIRQAQTVKVIASLAGFDYPGHNFYTERVGKNCDWQGATMNLDMTRFARIA